MSDKARIAVTGLGIVCALGRDRHEVWSSALEGRRGFRRVESFDSAGCRADFAAEVRGGPARRGLPRTLARRASRTDLFCWMAASEAVEQAGLHGAHDREPLGVAIGSSTGGMSEGERWCREGHARGFDRRPVSPILGLPTSAPADLVARALGAAGPRLANMTACASGALAIGQAADLIRSGEAPAVVAGGADALCLMTFAGFSSLRLLDPRPCRPFDASRQGLSLGEGAGALVLERWDHALARGATPLAELLDYGSSCDAHHMTAPHPDGRGAAAAMSEALSRSGIAPRDIGHVNAHGTGTTFNDAAEARAMRSVFGDALAARIPVTASKSMLGHVLGGAGALEAVLLVLSLMFRLAPPTPGYESGGDADAMLDIVTGAPRPLSSIHGMSNSFGFGGANCSLIFAGQS
jgi:3-oxoacyl-[acyl-carrier-protein] synthase II